MDPTVNRLAYRAYLMSPVWKAKRLEALDHYGCVCNRCGLYGTDVHHKTYERVGGDERMEDLEVLCRECHEAHHLVERCSRRKLKAKRRSGRAVTRDCIARSLTGKQKAMLGEKFGVLQGEVFSRITLGSSNDPLLLEASRMLGVSSTQQTSHVKWDRWRRDGKRNGIRWILGSGMGSGFELTRNLTSGELNHALQFEKAKSARRYLAGVGALTRS